MRDRHWQRVQFTLLRSHFGESWVDIFRIYSCLIIIIIKSYQVKKLIDGDVDIENWEKKDRGEHDPKTWEEGKKKGVRTSIY